MGGHQVPAHGSGDDGFDEDGYDESQRAEILEATGGGPTDGIVLTDMDPDLGDEIDADEDDDEVMRAADDVEDVGDAEIVGRITRDDD